MPDNVVVACPRERTVIVASLFTNVTQDRESKYQLWRIDLPESGGEILASNFNRLEMAKKTLLGTYYGVVRAIIPIQDSNDPDKYGLFRVVYANGMLANNPSVNKSADDSDLLVRPNVNLDLLAVTAAPDQSLWGVTNVNEKIQLYHLPAGAKEWQQHGIARSIRGQLGRLTLATPALESADKNTTTAAPDYAINIFWQTLNNRRLIPAVESITYLPQKKEWLKPLLISAGTVVDYAVINSGQQVAIIDSAASNDSYTLTLWEQTKTGDDWREIMLSDSNDVLSELPQLLQKARPQKLTLFPTTPQNHYSSPGALLLSDQSLTLYLPQQSDNSTNQTVKANGETTYGQGLTLIGGVSVERESRFFLNYELFLLALILFWLFWPVNRQYSEIESIANIRDRIRAAIVDLILVLPMPLAVLWGWHLDSNASLSQIYLQVLDSNLELGIAFFTWVIAWIVMSTLTESYWNATPGKLLFGLRVRQFDGKRLNFRVAAIRNMLRLVDFFPIFSIIPPGLVAFLLICFTERRLRIGDILAKTVVVQVQPFNLRQFVLASKSPRRKALLEALGLQFTTVNPEINEYGLDPQFTPEKMAQELSERKAQAVKDQIDENAIIIAADTIVVIDDEVIGKPKSKDEARRILKKLSGRTHRVVTGLTVFDHGTGRGLSTIDITEVDFRDIGDDDIDKFINLNIAMDKAGAYSLQDDPLSFIVGIRGSISNVMGLPMELLQSILHHLRC